MADKQVTVGVPEERVREFYVWFASFLAAEPGGPPAWGDPRGRRARRRRHPRLARRYSRKLRRELPISTEGREDGGTDYYLTADVARLFGAARASQSSG